MLKNLQNLRRKLYRYIVVYIPLIIMAIFLAMPLIPVHAYLAAPDSIALYSNKVFQNVLETDDMLFIGHGKVADTTPETPGGASTYYQYALYNATGTAIIASVGISAYSYNIYSLYFTKAQVTAAGITWGTGYYMRLMGNPALFAIVENSTQITKVLNTTNDWIAGTLGSTGTTRGLMKQYLLTNSDSLATLLASAAELNTSLTTTGTQGTFLNNTGRLLFLAAIPNLDSMCGEIFSVTVTSPAVTKSVFTNAYESELSMTSQLGAPIKTAFDGLALEFLGDAAKGRMMASMWAMMLMLLVTSIVFLYTGNTTASIICTIPMAFLATWVGAIPISMVILVSAGVVIYMAYYLFLRGL